MVLLRGVGLDMSVRCWRCPIESLVVNLNSILGTHVEVKERTRQTNVSSDLNIHTVASAPHIPHTQYSYL